MNRFVWIITIFLILLSSPAISEVADISKAVDLQTPVDSTKSPTRISIVNNQVIVPVKFWNNGRIITARMILDTGASVTTIYSKLASELNLGKNKLRRIKTTSANGSATEALLTKVDMIEVGDVSQSNADVIYMPSRSEVGADGLLGNSFLRYHKFTIDYNNRILRWE